MARADLDEFVECYRPENRNQRKATWDEKKNPEGRWRVFTYEELIARDKCSMDIFWLKDESLEDSANLPEPHVLAAEIAEDILDHLGLPSTGPPIAPARFNGGLAEATWQDDVPTLQQSLR